MCGEEKHQKYIHFSFWILYIDYIHKIPAAAMCDGRVMTSLLAAAAGFRNSVSLNPPHPYMKNTTKITNDEKIYLPKEMKMVKVNNKRNTQYDNITQ